MSRVTRLKVSNFLGLEKLDIKPGKVTVFKGGTGAGKTSALEAIEVDLTNQGRRPRLVREGEEAALLLVELDDGKAVERKVEAAGPGKLSVKQGGLPVARPQSVLNALLGRFIFNPVDFVLLEPKQQTDLLLSLVPLEVKPKEWQELGASQEDMTLIAGVHPLVGLKALEEAHYKQRTVVNAEAKAARTLAQELQQQIPEGFDPEAVRGKQLAEVYEALVEARDHNSDLMAARGELELQREEVEDCKARLKAAIKRQAELAERVETLGSPVELEPLEAEVRTYEAQKAALIKYDDAHQAEEQAATQEAEAQRLTELIKAARAKPALLLANAALPIEGMGISEEGEITIHGRPIKSLSSGEQIQLALQVARATAGELAILLVDGLERLDAEAQARLLELARQDQFQYFITCVSAGELEVTSY